MRPQASHALLAKQKSNDQKMLYHFSLKHVPYITRRLLQVAFQDSVTHEAGEKRCDHQILTNNGHRRGTGALT